MGELAIARRPDAAGAFCQHFALGRFSTDFMVVVDQNLIAALHEINFDSLDTPFLILIQRGNQLIIQRFPYHPQYHANIFLFRVRRQLFHVYFRHDVQHIAKFVPAFIQDDVRNSVLRGEIDVVLIRLRVDPGSEVHAVNIVVVPPVPGYLARLDPTGVLHL
jgi:hypothetical protein